MAGFDISKILNMVSGLQAGTGAAKSIYGLIQLLTNKRPDRPEYAIPEEINNMVGMYKGLASQSGFPGQDIMEDKLGRNVSESVSRARDIGGGSALGAVSQAYTGKMDAMNNLGIEGANFWRQNQTNLAQALGMKAEYTDKAWEYNKNMPYQQQYNEFINKKMSGEANLFGGAGDVATAGTNYMEGKMYNTFMKYIQSQF